MFGIDDLALALGAAKLVPKVWSGIASLFGKEAPKTVLEAGKLIDSVTDGIVQGNVSPEQQVQLKAMLLKDEQVKAQVELDKLRLEYQDQAGGRDVVKAALASEDPYVRQTRPKILRRLFGFTCVYSVFVPVIFLLACKWKVDAAQLGTLSSLLLWLGSGLWSAFLSGFLGYTVVRSKWDKQGKPSDLPGLAGAAMGLFKR